MSQTLQCPFDKGEDVGCWFRIVQTVMPALYRRVVNNGELMAIIFSILEQETSENAIRIKTVRRNQTGVAIFFPRGILCNNFRNTLKRALNSESGKIVR